MKPSITGSHGPVLRHIDKAIRRGDFAEVERLTRIVDRLHRIQHRSAPIEHEAKVLKNEERRVRIEKIRKWGHMGR